MVRQRDRLVYQPLCLGGLHFITEADVYATTNYFDLPQHRHQRSRN